MPVKPPNTFTTKVAEDATYTGGPADGFNTKEPWVAVTQGFRINEPVVAQWVNTRLYNLDNMCEWVALGSNTSAKSAHIVETDDNGVARVRMLGAVGALGSPGDPDIPFAIHVSEVGGFGVGVLVQSDEDDSTLVSVNPTTLDSKGVEISASGDNAYGLRIDNEGEGSTGLEIRGGNVSADNTLVYIEKDVAGPQPAMSVFGNDAPAASFFNASGSENNYPTVSVSQSSGHQGAAALDVAYNGPYAAVTIGTGVSAAHFHLDPVTAPDGQTAMDGNLWYEFTEGRRRMKMNADDGPSREMIATVDGVSPLAFTAPGVPGAPSPPLASMPTISNGGNANYYFNFSEADGTSLRSGRFISVSGTVDYEIIAAPGAGTKGLRLKIFDYTDGDTLLRDESYWVSTQVGETRTAFIAITAEASVAGARAYKLEIENNAGAGVEIKIRNIRFAGEPFDSFTPI